MASAGINDKGSGSATILEVTETYAAHGRTPVSKVPAVVGTAPGGDGGGGGLHDHEEESS